MSKARVKEIIKNNWKGFTVGVVLVGVTLIVTKRFHPHYLITGTGKTVRISKSVANSGAFYKVFNIYTPGFKHMGPSWMVQCTETGKSFRSINYAAKEMNLDVSSLSRHLSGTRGFDHIHGYHFTRIGVAV